ncbi:MAG: hypothetical protein OT477_13765 [Chloroflexi bacterium]|nr:hypothetical protein [Chloroflexota bacterium]
MSIPIIERLDIIPQLTPAGTAALAIGLVLSDGYTAWGACVGDDVPATLAEADNLLNQPVRIGLRGQPAESLGQMCGRWAHRTAITPRTEAVAPLAPQVADPSRRQLLRGFQPESINPTATRTVLVDAPLPKALAYGVSQACLHAAAHTHSRTPLAQWRVELGMADTPVAAVPLMGDVAQVEPAAVLGQIAAVAYTVPAGDSAQLIGRDGARLQAYVRQLGTWLGQTAAQQPLIYVDVRGHLGTVYNHFAGKLLGAISGLESSCTPHQLWLGDVALGPKAAEVLPSLRDFVRQRRLKTALVGRAPLGSVAAVRDWLTKGQVCHLEVWRFGSLAAVVEAVQVCRAAAVPVILAGHGQETAASAALLTDFALAAQPAFLYLPHPALAYNHQQQRLAELNGR